MWSCGGDDGNGQMLEKKYEEGKEGDEDTTVGDADGTNGMVNENKRRERKEKKGKWPQGEQKMKDRLADF